MAKLFDDDFSKLEYEGWSAVADLYDQTWSNLTKQFIDPLIETIALQPQMKVLDIACGPGYVSQRLYEKGAVVTGIDFSLAMINLAKQLYPHIDFIEGDAQQLDLSDASFDSVVMNFGMLHLAKPRTAMAEASRVLKKGGHYSFTVWAGPDKSPAAATVYAGESSPRLPAPDAHARSTAGLH